MNSDSSKLIALNTRAYPIALLDLAEKFYERRKFDVESLYTRCQIDPSQIARQQNSITGCQFRELVAACADIALPGTPLSVQLADCIPITIPGGMFGLASFTAKDVRQALALMIDFSHTVMPAYKFERISVGKQWHILLHPAVDMGAVQAHIDESVCGYFLNFRHFARLSEPAIQVHLRHEPLGDIGAYEEHFKAKFFFSQKSCKLIFDHHHLQEPLLTHNKATFDEVYLKLQDSDPSIAHSSVVAKVKKMLQSRLSQGQSTSISQAADMLNISERTLARRLQREGASFVELKQQASMDYAKLLLESTEQPVSKIARTCGYNSDSNFSRAFKSSTGQTPKQFRGRSIAS